MLDDDTHLILARVGLVLISVGVIDIAVMVYCIINAVHYSSSFNIFAVVLGILLVRGNLWAASVVRFFGALFLASGIALIVFVPFVQPIGLTLAEFRDTSPLSLLFPLIFLAVCFWTTRELNGEPVLAAIQSSGRSVSPLIFPVALGIGLVAAVGGVFVFT
jgi:hypothetical protein